MTDDDIKAMVDAFLLWPLPDDVCADAVACQPGAPYRTGTNLLTAIQARAMFEHCIAAYDAPREAALGAMKAERDMLRHDFVTACADRDRLLREIKVFFGWSWVRSVMSQGADIYADYLAGKHDRYEAYSARLDAAAAEREAGMRTALLGEDCLAAETSKRADAVALQCSESGRPLSSECTLRAHAEKERDVAITDAATDVLAERRRQLEAEGWTPAHDDEHDNGEMAIAAACYAALTETHSAKGHPPLSWPWSPEWWKPSADQRRNLVKAGALILAEIERIDRAEEPYDYHDGPLE